MDDPAQNTLGGKLNQTEPGQNTQKSEPAINTTGFDNSKNDDQPSPQPQNIGLDEPAILTPPEPNTNSSQNDQNTPSLIVSPPSPKRSKAKIIGSILALLILLISLPAAVILVQRNQELRQRAQTQQAPNIPGPSPLVTATPTPQPQLKGWNGLSCSPTWTLPLTTGPAISFVFTCDIKNDGSFYKGGEQISITNVAYQCDNRPDIPPEELCIQKAGTSLIYDKSQTINVPPPGSTLTVSFTIPDQSCGTLIQGYTTGVSVTGELSTIPVIGQAKFDPATLKNCTQKACQLIKIYDSNWKEIPTSQLEQLNVGDKIRVAAVAIASGSSTFDKARFNVNAAGEWQESDLKNPYGEFYFIYTIPPSITTFRFEAQLHNAQTGQWQN